MPEKLTACKDCRWYMPLDADYCNAPEMGVFNSVSGEWEPRKHDYTRCSSINTDGHCKHFKERDNASR